MLPLLIITCTLFATGLARPSLDVRSPSHPAPQIIGGQDAYNGQFPWQLSLEYLGSRGWLHTCGAVLIDGIYALTSAACVDGLEVQALRVAAGMLDRSDSGTATVQTILLSKYYIHEQYDPLATGVPNDLAVLTLYQTADTSRPTIAIATLPPDDTNSFTHTGCFMSGWGRNDTSISYTDRLQWSQIETITNEECATMLEGFDSVAVYDTHICSYADLANIAGCNGDQGSALVCYASETDTSVQYLAGVVSWFAVNIGNCIPSFPTASTRISKYLDWINTNTP